MRGSDVLRTSQNPQCYKYVCVCYWYYDLLQLFHTVKSSSFSQLWKSYLIASSLGCTNVLCRLALHICSPFSCACSAWPKLSAAWLRSHKAFVGVLTPLLKNSLPANPAQQKALDPSVRSHRLSRLPGALPAWTDDSPALLVSEHRLPSAWAVWWGSDPL